MRVEGLRAATPATGDTVDATGLPLRVLTSADLSPSISRRTQPMPYCLRNIDADMPYFVHRGTGVFATEFCSLPQAARTMSKGAQRMVAIGRALVSIPDVLLD